MRDLVDLADLDVITGDEFANLKALDFVIVGFLGDGVASCTRPDPQANALGAYQRELNSEMPDKLVD